MKWLIRIWVVIAIVMPALIGLAWIFTPGTLVGQQFPGEAVTAALTSLARMVGTREIIFSLLLLYAALRMPKSTVALLLVGRGLIDGADGLGVIAAGGMTPQALVPLVLALISFVVAYLITKQEPERVF